MCTTFTFFTSILLRLVTFRHRKPPERVAFLRGGEGGHRRNPGRRQRGRPPGGGRRPQDFSITFAARRTVPNPPFFLIAFASLRHREPPERVASLRDAFLTERDAHCVRDAGFARDARRHARAERIASPITAKLHHLSLICKTT